MTVYLDTAFLLNSAVNALLLMASGRLGGGRLSWWRVFSAAALGGAYSVLALLPQLAFLSHALLKIAVSALMLLLCFGAQPKTLRLGGLFWALSACFAGAVLVAVRLFSPHLLVLGGGVFYPVSAFGLMLVAAAVYLIAHVAFSGLCLHPKSEIIPLTLTLGSRSACVRALLDTGNTLRDPLTNEAVTVVSFHVLQELLPYLHVEKADFLRPAQLAEKLHALAPQLKPRLIPYKAVGVQTGFLLAGKLQSGNRQILAAFSPNPVSDGGNYEALIGEAV